MKRNTEDYDAGYSKGFGDGYNNGEENGLLKSKRQSVSSFNIGQQNAQKIINGSNYLEKVKEFHELFSHPVLTEPKIISYERAGLRFRLIREELLELEKAYQEEDVVEIADAFADLQYVLSGAILEFGLYEKFDKLFNEVHRSNMSKVAHSATEAELSCSKYTEEGEYAHWKTDDQKNYFIIRDSDGKTLKPVGYSKANLKPILFDDNNHSPEY